LGAAIRSGVRTIALTAAALILGAQLVALTHFHQGNPARRFNAQAQVVADDGLCALCMLVFHAPFNPAAAPPLRHPQAEARFAEPTVADFHGSDSFSSCQTRAPPAALA
jgi:hypothetical protein